MLFPHAFVRLARRWISLHLAVAPFSTGPWASSEGSATMRKEDCLDSWKEIATYLNREVRTVQLWETNEGLPVHRHWHSKLGTVRAYKTQIDNWLLQRSRAVHNHGSEPSARNSS